MTAFDARWKQVTCSKCNTTYRCTPTSDYYNATGPTDGVCEGCLLRNAGLNPEKKITINPTQN